MLTNHQIVDSVARTYNIRRLITRMIDYSIKDRSCDDLEQYIYEYLLTYDNERLNQMYKPIKGDPDSAKGNKLRNFISQIIIRQRNGGKMKKYGYNTTDYQKHFHIHETEKMYNESYNEDMEDEDKLYMLITSLSKIEDKEYTNMELRRILRYKFLELNYIHQLPVWKIAQEINYSHKFIYQQISRAKSELIESRFELL